MERTRRLRALWNWLPAFRAAAETQHLPTAARLLHVSTSSISRTVRLLEEELGHDLFERGGRSITLNRAGRQLLGAVRDAMRIMDEGVDAVTAAAVTGPVDIAAPRHLVDTLVLPAIDRLTAGIVPHVHAIDGTEGERLRRGTLDVALVEHIEQQEDVSVEHLSELGHGIYGGRRHPLAGRTVLSPSALYGAAFVSAPGDRWPVERTRIVAAHVPDLDMAARVCARGALLAVLPDVVGHAAQSLTRLACDVIPATPLYVAYRRPVAQHARTEAVLAALRAELTTAA